MSRYYNDYLQHSDEDTLAHFGIEVPKMHRDLKWALNNRFSSRKEVVAKSAATMGVAFSIATVLSTYGNGLINSKRDLAVAAAGGAIVGGILGTYMGHTMKNAQRENQEYLPYVE